MNEIMLLRDYNLGNVQLKIKEMTDAEVRDLLNYLLNKKQSLQKQMEKDERVEGWKKKLEVALNTTAVQIDRIMEEIKARSNKTRSHKRDTHIAFKKKRSY